MSLITEDNGNLLEGLVNCVIGVRIVQEVWRSGEKCSDVRCCGMIALLRLWLMECKMF